MGKEAGAPDALALLGCFQVRINVEDALHEAIVDTRHSPIPRVVMIAAPYTTRPIRGRQRMTTKLHQIPLQFRLFMSQSLAWSQVLGGRLRSPNCSIMSEIPGIM